MDETHHLRDVIRRIERGCTLTLLVAGGLLLVAAPTQARSALDAVDRAVAPAVETAPATGARGVVGTSKGRFEVQGKPGGSGGGGGKPDKPGGGGGEPAAGSSAKAFITGDGLHWLSAADIATALGESETTVNSWIKRGDVALSSGGQAVAWQAAADDSGLWFYAERVKDSIYTDTNVVWVANGSATVMGTHRGRLRGAVSFGQTFMDVVEVEENSIAAPSLLRDPESDIWFWASVRSWVEKSLEVPIVTAAGAGGEAWLRVYLQGMYVTGYGDVDAGVQLHVDGDAVGEAVYWSGAVAREIRVPLTDVFTDGEHTVTVEALAGPSGLGWIVVDRVEVEYPRYYEADDASDALTLDAAGHALITVTGLSGSGVRAYDITDPRVPQVVTNVEVTDLGGEWSATFAPATVDSRYLVLGPAALERVPELEADIASDLRNPDNAADYLIIAPRELEAGAQQMAEYRSGAAGGAYRVATAWLDDVQDEFAAGLDTPHAIRDFLSYVHQNWQEPPVFVLLLGEGHYDHKNENPVSLDTDTNRLPVLMTSTPYGLAASDNRYFDVAGDDGVPEFLGGRLPVLSNAEVADYLAKLTAYEAGGEPDTSWTGRVKLLADDPDNAGNFVIDSDALADLIPATYAVEKLYTGVTRPDVTTATNDTAVAAFEEGSVLYNYVGHGEPDYLAQNPTLFTLADAQAVGNGGRLPVFAALTCSAGNFAEPDAASIGDALVLNPGGGSIVSFVPTGLSINQEARIMNQAFVTALLGSGAAPTVGEAVYAAYAGHWQEGNPNFEFMRFIYSLLGDPATVVR